MWKTIKYDLFLDAQHRTDVSRRNEQCEEEQIYISWFIDNVCCLANQELPFRVHDGQCKILDKGKFVVFLNFLKHYDTIIENHVNSASVIKCTIIIMSLFHESCYYKIQISKQSCIQYIYLLFIYLLTLFSSVCIHSVEVNKYQASLHS